MAVTHWAHTQGTATPHCPVLGPQSWSQQTARPAITHTRRLSETRNGHAIIRPACQAVLSTGLPRGLLGSALLRQRCWSACVACSGVIPDWGSPPRSTVVHRRTESKTCQASITAACCFLLANWRRRWLECSVWRGHRGWRGQPTKGSASRTHILLCQRLQPRRACAQTTPPPQTLDAPTARGGGAEQLQSPADQPWRLAEAGPVRADKHLACFL